MLQFEAPGVYTQERNSGVHVIGGAPTAVALFVGATKAGIDNQPVRVTSYSDFERTFGGLDTGSSLSYSVLHFFSNGGGEAWIVRVPPDGAVAASTAIKRDGSIDRSVTLTARSAGSAGGEIFVEIDPFDIGVNPFETGANPHDNTRFNLSLADRSTGRTERFTNLSTMSSAIRYARDVVGNPATGSQLIAVTVDGIGAAGPKATGSIYRLKSPLPPADSLATKKIDTTVWIRMRDVDGAFTDGPAGATGVVWTATITLYEQGEMLPGDALAYAAKLKDKINEALRGSATAPLALKQAGIEVDVQEHGQFVRLRVGSVALSRDLDRVSDAMVTIATGGILSELLASSPAVIENVSRYRLGAAYKDATAGSKTFDAEVKESKPGVDGTSGLQPETKKFRDAITALDNVDPFFNTLCLPDLVRPSAADPDMLLHASAQSIYEEAARVCSRKYAFLLVDPFPAITSVSAAKNWKTAQFTLQSEYSAIYFPNVRFDDPLKVGAIRSYPPSGAIAGIFARTDSRTGVWEAPAGTDASINGTYGPSIMLSDAEHDLLNPIGVNVIRKFPIFGTVVFGSRTANGLDVAASDYKYVPVRRTTSYIERSLAEGLKWAMPEPNGEALWAQIRLSAIAFMQGLFRQGAFKGTLAREAYFVVCDSSTTTPTDIQQGIVNVTVGFAPLRPAEFVVITLHQIVQAPI